MPAFVPRKPEPEALVEVTLKLTSTLHGKIDTVAKKHDIEISDLLVQFLDWSVGQGHLGERQRGRRRGTKKIEKKEEGKSKE